MRNMNYDEIGPAEKYKYDYVGEASVGENPAAYSRNSYTSLYTSIIQAGGDNRNSLLLRKIKAANQFLILAYINNIALNI